MNVLLDIHHHDLFRSLYILFRKRLGFNVYLPFGMEWNKKFNYANYPSEKTVEQYLISCPKWINFAEDMPEIHFISLDEFCDTKIDIMVSSLLDNAYVFEQLNLKLNKKAKHIIQVGNNYPSSLIDSFGKNLLSSSWVVYQCSKITNKIFYHQEFDTSLFCHPRSNVTNQKTIYSLQHFFALGGPPYTNDLKLFRNLEHKLKDFKFGCYGIGGDRGGVPNIPKQISEVIKNSGFIFHVKPQGDGYGYIYHNAVACSKPVIFKSEYLYFNEIPMTPLFLFDDDISIDLSKMTIDEAVKKIIDMEKNYEEICCKVYNKFLKTVNFDMEFVSIKKFIENLK